MRSSIRAALRRPLLLVLLATVIALSAPPAPASAAGLDDAGYLAYAGRLQRHFDPLWDPEAGHYRIGTGGTVTVGNANLLLTHSVAALRGDSGQARADARARAIADWLVRGPVFVERIPRGSGDHGHAPGWTSAPGAAQQHLVFDAEVIDGLVHAYRARKALRLPAETVALIRDRIHRVARGPYWHWPALRLNQINWYALVYAADAEVTGRPGLLERGLGLQLARFLLRSRPHAGAAGNFGPGMRFHYLPHRPTRHYMNLDSAEYANIVLSFTRFYGAARRAGMPAPGAHGLGVLRAWTRRALAGYWTHTGYLNWDTGLSFARWHQSKKLGLTQHALIGMAATPELMPDPRWAGWAKAMLDAGLGLFERTTRAHRGLAPAVFFGVRKVPQGRGSARLGAARVQANAARAVAAGLGRRGAITPPPLYAYDPDTGRLAITTPAYNTAILPVNLGAVPYGGIEPARLFDGRQRVAATIGGRPPASFGMVVRDARGRRLLATQLGTRRLPSDRPALRLVRAPAGARASIAGSHGRAFGGPFGRIEAVGSIRAGGVRAVSRHAFTPEAIESWWTLRRAGTRRLSADVLFPSYGGGAGAHVVLADGARVKVGARRLTLAGVREIVVASQDSGYRVQLFGAPAGATVRLLRNRPQSSAPDPGPTVAVEVARRSSAARASLAARLIVRPAA